MSRVLLTGAGGFVGSHLALGLARLGFEVVATDREFDREAAARLAGLERLTCDVRDLRGRLGQVDFVIHGAAVTANPDEIGLSAAGTLKENVRLTLECLELAQEHHARRFILISSAGVFSGLQKPPLDETASPDGLGLYAAAKRMGELAAQSLRASGSLDALIVRLGNLYGPHERPRQTRPRMGLVARLLHEATHQKTLTLTTPEARREWTHVQDLAPAVAQLLQHPSPPDVTHLCAPDVLSDRALAETLQRLLPGTKLELHADATALPVRPPLESCFGEALLTHWTPLDTGLSQLARAGVPL